MSTVKNSGPDIVTISGIGMRLLDVQIYIFFCHTTLPPYERKFSILLMVPIISFDSWLFP